MTPQRWSRIKEVFFAAREAVEGDRAAYLDSTCGDDRELRAEVELLLANDDAPSLSRPAVDLDSFAPQFTSGQMLGQYRVEAKVGEGGMGAVYCAYDTRLRRDVALKVVSPGHLADPESKQRLLREARAASALNHPNVVTVYEIGSESGVDFIAMELVEGKTLKEAIPAKGLPLEKALSYAVQIAGGLAKAHAAGIVHRDLKPSNIMVTSEGLVKLLDFGLARRLRLGESETTFTAGGGIAGTPAYMSPEQAEGKPLDARSDVFSFGAVLYEMLTGRVAFRGDSAASVVAAVLREEPPPLGETAPHEMEKVVTRCLRKDPARRFQHMADVKVALEELKEESESGEHTAAQALARSRKRRFLWSAVVAPALVVLASVGVFLWQRMHAAPLTDKDVLVLADFTNTTGDDVFDDTLKQGLSVQLEQSPFLNLLSERKVNETLKLMGRPAGDRSTPEVTREVCQRTSSKAMLAGSIAKLGSQYVIGLKAVNCDTGDVLAEAQEPAANKEAVLKALDAAAVSLRSKLGESLSSVQKYATPVEEATTPSLEALKALQPGSKNPPCKGVTAELPFLKRALDLDPGFATGLRLYVGLLQYSGRSSTGGRKCTQGLRAAREGQRKGAALDRGLLLHICDGRTGEGGADRGVVAADLSERRHGLPDPRMGLCPAGKLGEGIGGIS